MRFQLSDLGAPQLSRLAAAALCGLALFCAGAFVFAVKSLHDPLTDAAPESARSWRPPIYSLETPQASKRAPSDEATLARPVFSKSRHPREKTDEAAASAKLLSSVAPTGLSLKGVVRVGGKTSVFIVSPRFAEGQWLKLGEALDGWTVKEAHDGVVTLSDGERSKRLEFNYEEVLKSDGQGPPPPAPPPPGLETAPQSPNIKKNKHGRPV